MPLFDFPLAELRTYLGRTIEPADFDDFWQRTLAEAGSVPLQPCFTSLDDPVYRLADVQDVTFAGFGGQSVKAWFLAPRDITGRLPCIVSFVGYGGGRSLPVDHLVPVVAGFAHLVMDTRGQGCGWSPGETADDAGSGPHYPGFMTRGIGAAQTYYYRRVFVDAVRAVEVASGCERVDPRRIAVAGGSQGGGIAIAAAGLLGERVRLLMADVPFLCDYRRATQIVDTLPYAEIARYLKCHRSAVDQVYATLDYFDCVNFAARVTVRSLFSVALMDTTCPPSTVFAAYNRLRAEREIRVYDFNEHEGGGPYQVLERLRFAARHL